MEDQHTTNESDYYKDMNEDEKEKEGAKYVEEEGDNKKEGRLQKEEDVHGVSIPMQYAKRFPKDKEFSEPKYRYFLTELPSESEDRGVTQDEFENVIKKVNKIWDPLKERFAGTSQHILCCGFFLMYH